LHTADAVDGELAASGLMAPAAHRNSARTANTGNLPVRQIRVDIVRAPDRSAALDSRNMKDRCDDLPSTKPCADGGIGRGARPAAGPDSPAAGEMSGEALTTPTGARPRPLTLMEIGFSAAPAGCRCGAEQLRQLQFH